MDGDEYHKVINVPSKATVISVVVIGVFLIYIALCIGAVIPSQYNIINVVIPENTINSGENTTGNTTNGTETMQTPIVSVWGMPTSVNVTNQPHTSWQITIKVVKGTVNNLSFDLQQVGGENITVSLNSQYSNWIINGTHAEYVGTLTQGTFITITMNIDANGNVTNGEITFMPRVVGVEFEGNMHTTLSS